MGERALFFRGKTDTRKPLLADELDETQRWEGLGLLVTYITDGRLPQWGLPAVLARGVVVIVGDQGKNFTRDKHFHRKGYGWRRDQGGGDEGNSLQKEQRILGVSVTWP